MAGQTPTTDEQLEMALRLLDGDEDVLGDILRTIGPSVLSVLAQAYQGVLTREDIEDVIAIAIHRLWVARERYDDRKASLKTWFFSIAENAARDVLKHGWHRARALELDLGEDFDIDQEATRDNGASCQRIDPNRKVSKAERDLKEIVAALPEKQRYIVMADACARDDVASSEFLADELEIPMGTVRVYRSRAMTRIRTEMRKRGH